MKYLYFPGCSLKGTGKAYEESLRAVFAELQITLEEIEDWNCCGATAYMSVDSNKAHALASRNLALAEHQVNGKAKSVDMVVPCSACFLVLSKALRFLENDALGERKVINALQSIGLNYQGKVRVRHPLDVLVNDVGLAQIKAQIKRPLKGMKVASYYGCQIVRPYAPFDDPYNPMTMDQLVETLGGSPVPWSLKSRCCGGSLTGTVKEVGLRLSYILLREAQRLGAQLIITACPLCQFNLECFQDEMKKRFEEPVDIPVVFFPQLMGRVFGLSDPALGMQRLFTPMPAVAMV